VWSVPASGPVENPLFRLPAVGDNAGMEAEPPKADPPKRKRRWFQFSLRTLMILVTLLAVPCAYVGWQAPIVQERLGDKPTWAIILHSVTSTEFKRIAAAFPEAQVINAHDDGSVEDQGPEPSV
jgi:hypothetical protein